MSDINRIGHAVVLWKSKHHFNFRNFAFDLLESLLPACWSGNRKFLPCTERLKCLP